VTTKTCASCAHADCDQVGLVEVCERWSNTDDPITDEEIERDLAPLSREECERRWIRHSTQDDHSPIRLTKRTKRYFLIHEFIRKEADDYRQRTGAL
jgi:hypothetical protein